jgi:AcrR family transcriptional regulator
MAPLSDTATGNPDEPGLRARKKEKTRADLRACAARLFAARGFDGTTIADIAQCANVSERTFFRYFDSKEALLVPDSADLYAAVVAGAALSTARAVLRTRRARRAGGATGEGAVQDASAVSGLTGEPGAADDGRPVDMLGRALEILAGLGADGV